MSSPRLLTDASQILAVQRLEEESKNIDHPDLPGLELELRIEDGQRDDTRTNGRVGSATVVVEPTATLNRFPNFTIDALNT